MVLKIAKNPTFTTEAKINVPTDDGLVEQSVVARFRVLPMEDLEALTVKDFVARALISVDGIVDETGHALDWTDEVKTTCLARPFFYLGVYRAYDFAMAGAKQGN